MFKNASAKGILIALIAFLLVAPVFAQSYTAAETKAIEKSKTLYNKGKYDKAISKLNPVLFAHIHNEDLWQLRVQYEYQRYEVQYLEDLIAIFKKLGKKGTVSIEWDKLKSTQYRTEMIVACYLSTLYAPHQELASSIIHDKIIEPRVDTSISDEAKEFKEKGDDEYTNQNYTAAIRQYQKAVDEEPTYYTATYDIAYSYYKDEKYEKAAEWFAKASALQPEMLNPRYFLIDSYISSKNWDAAYDACVEAMIQYPYAGYIPQMEKICDKKDKTFKLHWMERNNMPNMLTLTSQTAATEEPWSYYSAARDKIADYCNDEGIIKKSQTVTEQKYLESYSWEYMLKKSDSEDGEFGFARKQQEAGNLDCFVFFSMFHIAFWDQYVHFRDANRERLKTYITTQLTK